MQDRRWSWWVWALACLIGLVIATAIILALWKLPSLLYGDVTRASPDARLQAASSFRTAFVAGLAGLAALGSLVMASRTYRLTQQGQITDRYTKAIEQLGSDKLDVRLGGIYALERIAVDSRRDHPTVVEVLGAFVRERSQPAENGPIGSATDPRAAATVLGRLPETGVARGNLAGARLAGADLEWANLEGADLREADLRGANLMEANLRRANLNGAALGGADLAGANLEGATLQVANLEGANLFAATLEGAHLHRANLRETGLVGVDLTNVRGLRRPQLEEASVGPTTRLPVGWRQPDRADVRQLDGE
jgi:membrane protein implicated in regulation of membrane protease activity